MLTPTDASDGDLPLLPPSEPAVGSREDPPCPHQPPCRAPPWQELCGAGCLPQGPAPHRQAMVEWWYAFLVVSSEVLLSIVICGLCQGSLHMALVCLVLLALVHHAQPLHFTHLLALNQGKAVTVLCHSTRWSC